MRKIDALTRTEVARLVLGDGVKLLPTIAGKHEVDLLGFHRDLWELKPDQLEELFRSAGAPESKADAVPGGEAFTDLRRPLLRALERSGPGQGKVLGVVLLTDGQHNSGLPPIAKARELGERKVPIYPIALGAEKVAAGRRHRVASRAEPHRLQGRGGGD